IAMHQPLSMSVVERPGHIFDNRAHSFNRHWGVIADDIAEIFPGDVLHGHIIRPFALPKVEYLYDVTMLQPGDGLGFSLEAPTVGSLFARCRWQRLDRDGLAQRRVAGFIDFGRAAPPDGFELAVFAK